MFPKCGEWFKTFLDKFRFFQIEKFVPVSDPVQKCENNAIFRQKYTLKLFNAFKMAFSCCFSLG